MRRRKMFERVSKAMCCLLLAACGDSVPLAQIPAAPVEVPPAVDAHWIGAWGTAPHATVVLQNATARMVFRPSVGGSAVRVRLSNAYGAGPAHYAAVRIAKRSNGPSIDAASEQPVLFKGAPGVILQPEDEVVSDAVAFSYAAGDDIAISFFVSDASSLGTHGNAYAVSYLASGGNHLDDAMGSSFTSTTTSWSGALGLDVARDDLPGTFVALGDSITDGNNPLEVNNRWPDYFAARLADEGIELGIVNEGIGANQVTQDTNFLGMSQAAVTRFARDVLGRPNVGTVIIFEGTNDLAQGISADAIFVGITDMANRAHAQGLRVIGATVTPRGKDATWTITPAFEAERVKLNGLIRAAVGSTLDHLADFDTALAAPGAPSVMSPEFDSGDGLHPNPVGLMALADAVPLDFLP